MTNQDQSQYSSVLYLKKIHKRGSKHDKPDVPTGKKNHDLFVDDILKFLTSHSSEESYPALLKDTMTRTNPKNTAD